MKNLLNIEIIENDKGGHGDLVFEIPEFISQQKLETYYVALAIEPKSGIKEIKNAVAEMSVLVFRYSENPMDSPNVWFPFTKLVARQWQQTIHEPLYFIMTKR